jgi:hypothetical protein
MIWKARPPQSAQFIITCIDSWCVTITAVTNLFFLSKDMCVCVCVCVFVCVCVCVYINRKARDVGGEYCDVLGYTLSLKLTAQSPLLTICTTCCNIKKLCNLSSSSSSSSSSSCSWRVRRVSCSLILKMKLVPPSVPRSSYVTSSFWSIL